jgi:transposase-like protein
MARRRRNFTREFKISAVQLVNQQGYSIPEAARSLGVDPEPEKGSPKKGWSPKKG